MYSWLFWGTSPTTPLLLIFWVFPRLDRQAARLLEQLAQGNKQISNWEASLYWLWFRSLVFRLTTRAEYRRWRIKHGQALQYFYEQEIGAAETSLQKLLRNPDQPQWVQKIQEEKSRLWEAEASLWRLSHRKGRWWINPDGGVS